MNKDGASRCGVCSAEIVPGRAYEKPSLPFSDYPTQDWDGSRSSLKAWSALAATIIILVSGASSILYAGMTGLIIGAIMIFLGLSIGRSTVRYFRALPVNYDVNEDRRDSLTKAEMERPVFNGNIAPLSSLLQEMDEAESKDRDKDKR